MDIPFHSSSFSSSPQGQVFKDSAIPLSTCSSLVHSLTHCILTWPSFLHLVLIPFPNSFIETNVYKVITTGCFHAKSKEYFSVLIFLISSTSGNVTSGKNTHHFFQPPQMTDGRTGGQTVKAFFSLINLDSVCIIDEEKCHFGKRLSSVHLTIFLPH